MILGFDVAQDKTSQRIQQIVDSAPEARRYYTDGYVGYLDVIYPGRHIYNIHDKKDTFTVEGVNADLRHYIPILARRSRCFPRKLETLYAVVEVFVAAYNRFGIAKYNYRLHHPKGEIPFALCFANVNYNHSSEFVLKSDFLNSFGNYTKEKPI